MKQLSIRISISAVFIFLAACSSQKIKINDSVKEKHFVEISLQNVGRMYIDEVPNDLVMKTGSKKNNTSEFYSLLVGFQDSTLNASKPPDEKQTKYFQYDMPKDWFAIVDGDSLSPVFSVPRTKLHKETDEAIIVFEVPKGRRPDTLVYKDSFGPWSVQQIVLDQK
jgi:hypothetical protein